MQLIVPEQTVISNPTGYALCTSALCMAWGWLGDNTGAIQSLVGLTGMACAIITVCINWRYKVKQNKGHFKIPF